ncbi:plastocyanin/azurin family copper-binding protein [Haladaptatus salinisoli]|uniref:plastocyanin/azurin family copper-binding protein n=1 Tax=Haladaptatus salinisoli TaxID=2884876 RepID=UPI001D0A54B4|nr:plastocyanin/azurin family copper-binding protein [Haladaptatus salinisoli]
MKRRDFLLAASGVAGGTAAAAAPAGAQQTTTSGGGNQSGGNGTGGNQTSGGGNQSSGNQSSGNKSQGGGGGGGGGPTKTVKVGPGGNLTFEPSEVTIPPGGTIKWVWESNTHNVVPESQPSGSSWQGSPGAPSKTYDSGYTYSHTFDTPGEYAYFCQPHKSAGMTGTITVGSAGGGGGGAAEEADPEEMGVPFQAHYVGIATILMMVVSLIYTFFFLKYGESAHTSGGNR